ncbi:hypothetical protein EST38_g1521 [Candolleomyces aberdarensis]|uniref:Uncharacterized protein n=1 Tax=Candolleomyces aberdarensis TaxID=2316362 RepID=A0A4Q2DX86_9AGAR|nr:hypothetical protein EST38_g1521 [Candolleomyces aberdarensis]
MNSSMTCKLLEELSYNRAAWREIFLNYFHAILPKPFFLPKPLQECSSKLIEQSLANWEAEWAPTIPTTEHVFHASPDPIGKRQLVATCLLPGGRWLLAGYRDGSVWYFDLDAKDTICSTLLIESPYPESLASTNKVRLVFSVDLLSDVAQASPPGSYHLTQFNIAIVASHIRRTVDTVVSVWRVQIALENDSATSLRKVELLSTFHEERFDDVWSCDLYGTTVAYLGEPAGGDTSIIIVDWSDAAGQTDINRVLRRYISSSDYARAFLLPEDRILTVANYGAGESPGEMQLVHWRRDCPATSTSPSQQTHPLPIVGPRKHGLPLIYVASVTSPVVIADELRFVVPARGHLYGLVIPLSFALRPEEANIQVELLVTGEIDPGQQMRVGYHQMFSMTTLNKRKQARA